MTKPELAILLAVAAGRTAIVAFDTHEQRQIVGDSIRAQLVDAGLKVRYNEQLHRMTVMPAEGHLLMVLLSEPDRLRGMRASLVWAPYSETPPELAACVGPGGRVL
jgi:phage terminase large subunit-like protein